MEHVNFTMPNAWTELSDKQLRYVFALIAANFGTDEIKLLCLFKWNKVRILASSTDGKYILRAGKLQFAATPMQLAELLPELDWLGEVSPFPVRIERIGRRRALPADFQGVPFESFIICDNLYQGYLATQSDELIDNMAEVLYNGRVKLSAAERISVFYWFASLKGFFAAKFSDFFQPVGAASDGNLLGNSPAFAVEEAMNAQIRALTKGDITKEREVLALDTWRALTELNAQAKEYKQINSQIHAKK